MDAFQAITGRPFPFLSTGAFRADQASQAGISPRELVMLVDAGALRRPFRGVYLPDTAPDTLAVRTAALALVVPPHAFVCDYTAAWLHAGDHVLPPNADLRPLPVSYWVPSGHTRVRQHGVASGQRDIADDDLTDLGSLRVTSPLRTALDLGRLQPWRDAKLAGMDAMLALGAFEHEHLLAEVPRFRGQRGVVSLRTFAPLADGGAASFGESSLRLRWLDAGLPRPQTQVEVESWGRRAVIDLGLPEFRFGAEYDGAEWHSATSDRVHDSERRDWLGMERWELPVYRRDDVYGHRQSAEADLRRRWHDRGRRDAA